MLRAGNPVVASPPADYVKPHVDFKIINFLAFHFYVKLLICSQDVNPDMVLLTFLLFKD